VVSDVTDEHLASFLASGAARNRPDGKPKRPGSMNALRSSLRTFFAYLVEAGLIETNPARLIRMAICSPPPPRALRDHEEVKLRAVMEAAEGGEARRDLVLFELMLATGIRLSSALALDVEDLDLEAAVIHLRVVKRGGEQRVFMCRRALDLLVEFVGERRSGPLFQSVSGRRITCRHAQRRFRRWRHRAGVSDSVTPHGLRHAFAQRLYGQTRDGTPSFPSYRPSREGR